MELAAGPSAMAAADAGLEVDDEERASHFESIEIAKDVLGLVLSRGCDDTVLTRSLALRQASKSGEQAR